MTPEPKYTPGIEYIVPVRINPCGIIVKSVPPF